MSVAVVTTIMCDGCGMHWETHDVCSTTARVREARMRVRIDGWATTPDGDLCPECRKAKL